MCAFTNREISFISCCMTGAHFLNKLYNEQCEEVEFIKPPHKSCDAWFLRKVPAWFIEIMQLLRSGWFEWELGGFPSVPTSSDRNRLSHHRKIRSFLRFAVTFSTFCSPVWTKKRELLQKALPERRQCVYWETISSVWFLDQCVRLLSLILMQQNNSNEGNQ